jgi:mycofactocin system glycosyltransferase
VTTLAFDPSARLLEGGRVLVGGHPARMLRLTPAGARLVASWRAGAAVGASEGARRLAERLIDAELAHPRPSGGAVTPADVAVVIPARDRPDALAECLARIGPCREIVIVDDGSSDPGAIAAVAASFDERVVRRDVSGGPAAARNAGLAATDAPFVAFVDSDTLPAAGWLEPLLAHFGDPRLGAVAPRVTVPAGTSALARYEAVRSPLDLGPDPGVVGPGRRVGYVPAAALVVRRAAFSPFDETMRFGEDVDLVWRLVAGGWIVRYEPASVVEHPQRASLRAWVAQRAAYGSSAGPLAERHPGRMRHVVVPRAALVPWALALAGRPELALAAAALDLRHVGRRELVPLALESQARTARQIADAAWRAHPPLLATTRRGRRFLAAALVAGAAADYLTRRPRLDPVRFTALRAADDLAYAAGVWAGCARARTAAPLIPSAVPRRRTR